MTIERDKPDWCYDSGCPLAATGKRFVLGCGDPTKAKLAMMLEGPGQDEIAFQLKADPQRTFYSTQESCNEEIGIRRRDYPALPGRFLTTGVPVVGRSGFELVQWAFPAAGVKRGDLFIDNTLRCLPPKHGDSHYPQGDERKKAEACCRHYDRWNLFKPDISVVSLHPAGIVRESTGLWLQVKNLEKARDFARTGLRTLLLAGGKAVKWFLGYGENVTRWQSHYEWNTPEAQERRRKRLEEYMAVDPTQKKSRRGPKEKVTGGTRKRATIDQILGIKE